MISLSFPGKKKQPRTDVYQFLRPLNAFFIPLVYARDLLDYISRFLRLLCLWFFTNFANRLNIAT